jgi:hypothetical protein
MFDALMSGRYDWLLFPLGLVAIALLVTGVWLDFGQPSHDIRHLIACEATAMEKPGLYGHGWRLARIKYGGGRISNCPVGLKKISAKRLFGLFLGERDIDVDETAAAFPCTVT